jgi:putative ABC transport system permease protein
VFVDDLRHAARRLRAQPGNAAIASAMLALAIGLTSAMFTIVDHMLLRPVPYRDPAHLVTPFVGTGPHDILPYVTREVIRAWRSSPAFSAVHGFVQQPAIMKGESGLSSNSAVWITPGSFEMLGVAPMLGRTFVESEGRQGTDDRIIISERVWRSQYASDPNIVGRRILVSGAPTTVVGVLPPGFHFPYWMTDVWRPYDLNVPPTASADSPVIAYARLARDMPLADAARLATIAASGVEPLDGRRIILRSVAAGFLDDYSRMAIMALAGGVALVFLVLCANVTNLILARTTDRRQEFGVCSALGASRGRLLRQAFAENVLLSLVATIAGLFAAWQFLSVARSVLPEEFLIRTLNPVQIDWRAIAATSLLAMIAALGSGLLPAWIGTALNPADSIRSTGRGGTETRASRAWTRSLLVAEVALATALLVAAGVLVTSFVNLMAVDPGLDVRRVVTASLTLPEFAFQNRQSRSAFAEELHREMQSLPGVESVALSFGLPPEGGAMVEEPVHTDVPGAPERRVDVLYYYVGPEFFRVYGINLIQGRGFRPTDGANQAVVSEKLARLLWPGTSPLNHTFTFKGYDEWYHVVGVSREVRSSTMVDPLDDLPEFYTPSSLGGRHLSLGVRCGSVCPDERSIRDRIRATSPNVIVSSLEPLDRAYSSQFARPRAASNLALSFAVVAILAVAGGLFSVLSYAVGRRRREFGIRIAMGAQPHEIRGLVLRDAVGVALLGLGLGMPLAWLLSQALTALAPGVTIVNPVVWGTTVAIIVGATLFAAWRPAVSAMRTDPLALMRDE